MSKKFGLFINLDYAHKKPQECTLLWKKIMNQMLNNGFSFEKRVFTICTQKNTNEISQQLIQLLDEIQIEQSDFYSYLSDCYILDFANCNDLTLPNTSDSIVVEDVSLEDLNAAGINYETLFKKIT